MSTNISPPGRAPASGGELRLPTPPGIVRRFWNRHPHPADGLITAIYVVPMALTLVLNALNDDPAPLTAVLLNAGIMVLLAVALLFRRRMPLLVLALTWMGLVTFADYGEVHLIAQLLALYAVAVYSNVRSAWIGFSVSVLLAGLAAWLTDNPAEVPWIPVASQSAIMLLAATLVGVNMGNSKRYVASLLDLAAQLTRERDQQAQLARISERTRIAGEMHDVVAHSLSVMVALADGAHAIAPKDVERSRAAMLDVAATGRRSMTEMRRLLGVLEVETEPAPRAPQPGIDQLADLVESFRSTGLPVVLGTQRPRAEQRERAADHLSAHPGVIDERVALCGYADQGDRASDLLSRDSADHDKRQRPTGGSSQCPGLWPRPDRNAGARRDLRRNLRGGAGTPRRLARACDPEI
ncbi:hypothetical protein E3N85_15090 [Cryobacterium sp. Hz9]|nr:histidine kinase [Cryobacterium sp. Hz9]TFB64533.1 hypothetical protein E3N85_15090 [Cryobacterium sp. Hz9]